MRIVVALALVGLACAELVKKPTKEQKLRREQWKVATVEEGWETNSSTVNPSQPDEKGKIRPRMEIIPTKHEVGGSTTAEVFWQRPNATKIKGIFLGATGCFHQAGDFFEQVDPEDGWEFEACKNSKMMRCSSMPDNIYSFKYAMERGYVVMAMTPQDKNSCWNHELDPARIDEAIKFVIHTEGLNKSLPLYATGASQGGYFMYDMQNANVRNLQCIAPQCAEMKFKSGKEHLPTMVIWMPKDVNLTNPIRESIDYLKTKKVKVTERTPHGWKFQELLRARGYNEEVVQKILGRLQHAKGNFGHKPVTGGGHIVDHPGTDNWWKRALRHIPELEEDNFVKDHSKMHHLMQVAFAEHEYTAEYTDHILDFCEGHEDRNKPLRFGREPSLKYPSDEAKKCSPNCPPPGMAATGGLSNFGLYLADIMSGKKKDSKEKKSLLQK
jgi:hypothetical protein